MGEVAEGVGEVAGEVVLVSAGVFSSNFGGQSPKMSLGFQGGSVGRLLSVVPYRALYIALAASCLSFEVSGRAFFLFFLLFFFLSCFSFLARLIGLLNSSACASHTFFVCAAFFFHSCGEFSFYRCGRL